MKSLLYTAALLPLASLAVAGKPHEVDEVVVVTTTRTVTVCPITDYWTCAPDGPTGTGAWDDWGSTSPTGVVTTTTKTGGPATTTPGSGNGGDDDGHGGHGGHGSGSSTTPVGPGTTSSSNDDGHGGHGGGPGSRTSSTTPAGPVTTSSSTDDGHGGHGGGDSTSSTTTSYNHDHPGGSDSTTSSPVAPTLPTYTTSAGTTSSHGSDGPGKDSSTSSSPAGTQSTSGVTTSASLTTSSSTTKTTTTSTSCVPSQTVSALPETGCSDNTANDRSKWCGKSVGDDTHVHYESGDTKYFQLTITSGQADFDGTSRPSFLINGGTPGPLIEVNYGDWVEVTVTNLMTDNATTIHWHGVRQIDTNDQDGVPGVTECAIPPLAVRTYKWHASTYGTGWYHSHALSQYGGGIRGPVIIHGPSTANYDYDMGTVMVDEIFSQTIFQMAWNIARLRGPLPAAVNYMLNGKNKAVDGTKGKSAEWTVHPGKKHLFRFINSSAQASYVIHFDNHKMTVISADYTPIVPYTTDTLYINPGQRYNVIVEMNQTPGAYFLRAITQTGCGTQNLNNGLGSLANGIFTYKGSCGTPVTDTLTPTIGSTLQTDCKDEPLASLVPFVQKNGGSQDKFASDAQLLPGGNAAQQAFDGYGPITRWYFGPMGSVSSNTAGTLGSSAVTVDYDNPTLKNMATLPSVGFNSSIYSNAVVLDGTPGDWVYFVIQNNFQTSHPIHLHGHDFSVLGQGKGTFSSAQASTLNFANPIRRDTALVFGIPGQGGAPQGGWTVIGFQTDNPGAWVMHCHIIWHADGGMALQYIEQPSAIPATDYYTSESFQSECAAYDAYVAAGGDRPASYESGLKRDLQRHRYGEKRFGRHGMH
ncbi:Laccase-1 [Cladophialophora carrionii]|uniref:laccase n=1 Tax=Cladophialophora carrionii TaxID=86049 RepID=A0A1C1CVI2_9EURO|nr:Laccase-1 [Cladophialophora carrionii]